MTLTEMIASDPALGWRVTPVDDVTRDRVRNTLAGFWLAYQAFDLHSDLDPELQYAAFIVSELNYARRHLRDVSPISVVAVREQMIAPHDEEGQLEYRAAVTLEWLRVRLGTGAAN